MRKACALLLLLLAARPGHAQRGAEPELMPAFKPSARKKAPPRAQPLRELAPPSEETTGYDILPARKEPPRPPDDLMRRPRAISLGAKQVKREYFTVRSRFWFFKGSVDTRYAWRLPSDLVFPPSFEFDIGETEKRDASGMMRVDSLEFAPLPWLSFVGEYGQEKETKGAYDDRYWVHSPNGGLVFGPGGSWTNPEHEDDAIFSGRAAGKADWAAGSLYFRVVEARIAGQDDDSFRHSFDLGLGMQRLRQRQRLTELVSQPSPNKFFSQPAPGPLPGFDSTYDSVWEGFHIAMRETVKFPARFSFEGEALWAPIGLQYRGDGFNNTQVAGLPGFVLRAESPNFEDRARGAGLHFRLAGQWTYGPFTVEGGFQKLYFYSRTGRRRYFLLGGGHAENELNFAKTDLGGAFVGGTIRF